MGLLTAPHLLEEVAVKAFSRMLPLILSQSIRLTTLYTSISITEAKVVTSPAISNSLISHIRIGVGFQTKITVELHSIYI
jgi:hypothetical protein